jgi:hypothetical protein
MRIYSIRDVHEGISKWRPNSAAKFWKSDEILSCEVTFGKHPPNYSVKLISGF